MSKSFRSTAGRTTLALSCIGTALLPLAVSTAHAEEDPPKASDIIVTGTKDIPEQASPKAVRPLADTPQTVTVLDSKVMQQQNILSLRDALATVPGITFGAGEGGSGYGDSINLRGYSASNDITIDGVRDSAQYSRTDNFNIDQIEISNGASSVTNGSGSVGGNINLVTKRPLAKDQDLFDAGVGTDNYYRATADINQKVTDSIAVRLNAMFHRNDVPGRDVEDYKRWGVAPSITIGLGTPTRLTAEYYHQEDNNIPQYGIPYFTTPQFQGPLPGVDRHAYYGFRNIDTQRSNLDQANLILDHDIADGISLRNLFRYEDVTQFSRADGPEGTFCLPSGLLVTGAACVAPAAAGFFTPTGGSRGNTRDTNNRIIYNQTDLNAVFNTGPIEHTLDVGISISDETYSAATGNSQRNANGTTPVIPNYPIYNPNAANVYTGPLNFIVAARPHSRVFDYASYIFDAMKFSKHFEINAGLRVESNSTRFRSDTVNVAVPVAPATVNPLFGTVTVGPTFKTKDQLVSYRAAAVYHPVDDVTLYVAYGNSKTPSQSSVNGSCTAATCNVKPEGAKNYEVGVKASLFHEHLLLTAAAFRNARDSYKVASNDPTVPDQQLDGSSRVDGIALGATGNITRAWSITANYTYLDSKLIRSVSRFCIAHPGTTGCANSVQFPDPAAGSPLVQTPKNSGSVYTSYVLPFGLTLGYGVTYQGRFAINTPTLLVPNSYYSKSYWVHNATLAYNITDKISAQVNVKNIFNKLYYTRIRSTANGWATPGDARSAVLTLSYKM